MGIFDRLFGRQPEPPPAGLTVTLDLLAAEPGDLAQVARLDLPPGRPVVATEGGGVEVAWVTQSVGDHARLWARLAEAFPRTGLWPVLANGLADGDLTRPWFDGELAGPDPDAPDPPAHEVLERGSANAADDPAEEEPRDHALRGLAGSTRSGGSVTLNVPTGPAGLLLVPVRRPADVPRALGWWGPVNYDLSGADQSAVLRSWEDRFGAVLVGLAFDVMHLAVADPPTDPVQCDRLAREHYAFCPDNVEQGVGSLEDYAPMVSEREWWFWWD
jgi:hypothetical protein